MRVLRMIAAVGAVAVASSLAACNGQTGQQAQGGYELPTSTPSKATTVQVAQAQQRPGGRWLSGASGDKAAQGTFGRWRHAPVAVGGTWDDNNERQVKMESVCPGGTWATWNKPLDIAVGAIDRKKAGETWQQAAAGAYDARWRASLLKLKKCWGKRNPANLYIRFAHEMNLSDMKWYVRGGEEAFFLAAWKRYSNLRYEILPKAKLVFCPSDGTDRRLKLDIRTIWPGKDDQGRPMANIYGVDTYNSWVRVLSTDQFIAKAIRLDDLGYLFGIETHRQFAEEKGVPFVVSEWSNNGDPKAPGGGSDQPQYVKDMNQYFRDHGGDPKRPKAGQLLYEIQYNYMEEFEFLPTRVQPKTAKAYKSLKWGR